MKVTRRGAMAAAAGGAVAMSDVRAAGQMQMAPTPTVPGYYYGEEKQTLNVPREPSIEELRAMRAKHEAMARGEGWRPDSYLDRYDRPSVMDLQALRSVSPAAKSFIGRRGAERRDFERYCQSGKEQLEHFIKNWAWKLL